MTPEESRAACEGLTRAYNHHADTWNSDALAALFTPDGVFDRLGTRIEGRAAIAHFIDNRPREYWQIHTGRNFTFDLAADGRSATGTLDLDIRRGRIGDASKIERVEARFRDRFVLTKEGWRFALREVGPRS